MRSQFFKDVIRWDVVNWSQALRFWEQYYPDKSDNILALELGANEGGISLWLAKKGAQVLCSDITESRNQAIGLHQKYDIVSNISYEDIDATSIPYSNHFDIVCFKSILGGIGRNNNIETQRRTILEIHKSLKPGGTLFFAENLIASPIHRFFRKKFISWGSSWRYVSIIEMLNFLKQFTEVKFITVGFFAAFGRSEKQREMLGLLDSYISNRIIPRSWRYIIVGIAKK